MRGLRSHTFMELQCGCVFPCAQATFLGEPRIAVQLAGALNMTRAERQELERKLEQARRLALEPTDPLTRERLAQLIEELEFQLQDQRKVA